MNNYVSFLFSYSFFGVLSVLTLIGSEWAPNILFFLLWIHIILYPILLWGIDQARIGHDPSYQGLTALAVKRPKWVHHLSVFLDLLIACVASVMGWTITAILFFLGSFIIWGGLLNLKEQKESENETD